MSSERTHVEGIYFNSSDTPVFLEHSAVGGHDYVYLEGYLRIPGHFVRVQDPQEDPDAPETFRVAYGKLMEKGRAQKQETHSNSTNRRSNVVTDDEPKGESEDDSKVAKKPTRASRKGKSDSTSNDEGAQ